MLFNVRIMLSKMYGWAGFMDAVRGMSLGVVRRLAEWDRDWTSFGEVGACVERRMKTKTKTHGV